MTISGFVLYDDHRPRGRVINFRRSRLMPKGIPLTFREKQRRETEKKIEKVRRLRERGSMTFAEIGHVIGVSTERARQLYVLY